MILVKENKSFPKPSIPAPNVLIDHKNKENIPNTIKLHKKINYINNNHSKRKFGTDLSNQSINESNSRCTEIYYNNLIKLKLIPILPIYLNEYFKDIMFNLKVTEDFTELSFGYLKSFQPDINDIMRSILLDWIVDVHLKFGLLPETLYITVYIIDRYLKNRKVSRSKFQLIGITSLLIASKYEEISVPEMSDLVYISDGAYTKSEIISMESEILSAIEYNITFGSSLKFLELYNVMFHMDEELYMLSRYILELFLVDYLMLKYKNSLLAAVAIFIALKITKKFSTDIIPLISNYDLESIKNCAIDACVVIDKNEKSTLKAITKKFRSEKYCQVSNILLHLN